MDTELVRPDGGGSALGVGAAAVAVMRRVLGRLDPSVPVPAGSVAAESCPTGLTEQQCVDLVRELEDLKASAAGAQAVVTAHLAQVRSDAERVAGVPARRRGQGLASEIALARRVSPHLGGRHLGLALALVADMPHTLAALRTGRLSEWRATLLVRESICLGAAERRALDEELCRDPERFAAWGDRRFTAEAKRVAYRLDPHSAVERAARAEGDRSVTIRPAPDTMAYLTALLPVSQAVAVHAALLAAASSARATGDPRGKGQVMADTLVSRVTGREPTSPADVHISLVMTDRALLDGGSEPAAVPGHGPVPSAWAREIVRRALAEGGKTAVWVQRVFTDTANHLVAIESRGRTAPPGLARYLALREGGSCRTAYCDASVRHIDHVVPVRAGGTTSACNLQGLCERCNYTKELPGWHATTGPAPRHARAPDDASTRRAPPPHPAGPTVVTTTPTGHRYPSPPVSLPRTG